jgi:hypothetical protein
MEVIYHIKMEDLVEVELQDPIQQVVGEDIQVDVAVVYHHVLVILYLEVQEEVV